MAKKQINVGGILIGGGAPVTVQSMTNTKTENVADTVAQIKRLEAAGCDIVRLAVPTMEAARAIYDIKSQVNIPIVADIHFDYKLAIAAAEAGADKIRINPGNIGGEDRVKAVVDVCKARNLPIRIGVNGGSLEKELIAFKTEHPNCLTAYAAKKFTVLNRSSGPKPRFQTEMLFAL